MFLGLTKAWILNICPPVWVFADILTIFCCKFGLPVVSKFTSISPVSPGLIAIFFGYLGTVQPQLPLASTIYKSFWLVFVKVKNVLTIWPSLIFPKSWKILSKVISAYLRSSDIWVWETSPVSYTHLTLPTSDLV